jgi:hypothetical protein
MSKIKSILNSCLNSMKFWTLVLIITNVINFIYVPFLLIGNISIAVGLLFIYSIIGYNLADSFTSKDIYSAFTFSSIILFVLTITFSSAISIVKNNITEMYKPISLIKNEGQIGVIGKYHMIISDSLRLYTSNNLYICKDKQYNGFNIRMEDKWYICIK